MVKKDFGINLFQKKLRIKSNLMEVFPEDCENNPSCPHGPCLIFERRSASGAKTGRKFYACSACRDRHECSFFHWIDDKLSKQKKLHWKKIINESEPPYTHEEFMKRLTSFQKLSPSERCYCKTCSLLILPGENNHNDHEIISTISSQHLLHPSSLFQILENKRAEAQYFFTEETTQFVANSLLKLGFSKFLLIGTPKIHEYINSVMKKDSNISSFLMDIDYRYMQFFGPEEFCRYNIFNNHFFSGKKREETVKQFLQEKDGEKVVVLVDPPFGGLIDAISYTLHSINRLWRSDNSKPDSEIVPLLWFFPYFMEPRIIKSGLELTMLDYKVEYLNHRKFRNKENTKGSPVRIFTNISASSFALPKDDYRFCKQCQKYVSKENLHCKMCNSCTTKHGQTYKHCYSCGQCVKNSYVHCDSHNKCSPAVKSESDGSKITCLCTPDLENERDYEKCFKCFGYGHKRRHCPLNQQSNKKKKKESKK